MPGTLRCDQDEGTTMNGELPRASAPSAPSASQELSEGRLAVSIGISIFLLLAGAILRFAVTWSPEHINLQIVGVIFMIAGGAGLIASIIVYFMKRRRLQAQEAAFRPPRYTEPPPPG